MPQHTASRSDYLGCGLWAGGFVVLVIVSFSIGIILRPDPPRVDDTVGPDDITLTDVGPRAQGYRLVGARDDDDKACVFLFQQREQVTGQCGLPASPDDLPAGEDGVTSSELEDGTIVVFGPAPDDAATAVLDLDDGTTEEVGVQRNDEAEVSFFLAENDRELTGLPTFLGRDGEPVPTSG